MKLSRSILLLATIALTAGMQRPTSAVEQACAGTSVFIFVGNAEQSGVGRLEYISDDKLPDVVRKNKDQLRGTLLDKPKACAKAGFRGLIGNAALVSVTDGPQMGDSAVETYTYQFDKDSSLWFEQKITAADTKAFELHLPTQVESTIRKELDVLGKQGIDPTQLVYVLKSHGGAFYSPGQKPNIDRYFAVANGHNNKGEGRAFLFDLHGPKTKHLADVYQPYMPEREACMAFERKLSTTKPSERLCQICKSHVEESPLWSNACKTHMVAATDATETLSPMENDTLSPVENDTLSPMENDTLSPMENDTLSPMENDTLSPMENDTLSPMENDTLSPMENDTLSPMENDTLSPMENDTLSPMENDTLSPMENDTLAPGKSFMFVGAQSAPWQVGIQLASGVAYAGTTTDIKGFTHIKLPMYGTTENPGLVILDSCYGHESLLTTSFTEAPARILLSQDTTPLDGFSYESFDYLDFTTRQSKMAEEESEEGLNWRLF